MNDKRKTFSYKPGDLFACLNRRPLGNKIINEIYLVILVSKPRYSMKFIQIYSDFKPTFVPFELLTDYPTLGSMKGSCVQQMMYKFAQPADVIITNDGTVYLILADHDGCYVTSYVQSQLIKVVGHIWTDERYITLEHDD